MTHTLQNRYVVVTGDLKSSRKLKDRAEVQEELKNALRIVNRRFEEEIPAKFMVVGGDSFQGMLSSPKYLFDIYYVFVENIGHQFYLGIGVGGISTSLSENVGEIDGEAFHKASDALKGAKKENMWIAFKSEWEIDEVVTCLLNFMADVMWNWTDRQKKIIIYFREQGENREAVRLASKNFGVGERSIYKTLRTGKYHLWRDAEMA
ncbi:MAG: SatD family protein, partial [Euryarchaeota archaeon]|nr:SatD family protein [Euryarchaeota archaeon]